MKNKNYSREEVIEILKFVNGNFEVRADNGLWYKREGDNNFYSNEKVIEEFEESELEKKSKVN